MFKSLAFTFEPARNPYPSFCFDQCLGMFIVMGPPCRKIANIFPSLLTGTNGRRDPRPSTARWPSTGLLALPSAPKPKGATNRAVTCVQARAQPVPISQQTASYIPSQSQFVIAANSKMSIFLHVLGKVQSHWTQRLAAKLNMSLTT